MSDRSTTDSLDESLKHGLGSPLLTKEHSDDRFVDDEDDFSSYSIHDAKRCTCHQTSRSTWVGQWRTNRLSFLLNAVLILCCVCLIGVNVVLRRRNYDIFAHVPPYNTEVIYTPGVAPPLLGPEFQKRTVVFQRNESFMYEKVKAYPAWHEILHVARHGRVAFASRPDEFFGVGGYHELHCVWLLQQAVDLAANGPRMTDELQIDHMYHCAEFLRQSVMCHADNTIERRFEGILGPFSANNTHVCGNWDALMKWSDDHIYTGPYLNPHTKLPP